MMIMAGMNVYECQSQEKQVIAKPYICYWMSNGKKKKKKKFEQNDKIKFWWWLEWWLVG